jgi:hypothetical protein
MAKRLGSVRRVTIAAARPLLDTLVVRRTTVPPSA